MTAVNTTIHCDNCGRDIGIVQFGTYAMVKVMVDEFAFNYVSQFLPDPAGTQINYIQETGLLSLRMRPDGKWGIQCDCGADTLMHPAEADAYPDDQLTTVDVVAQVAADVADYDALNPPDPGKIDGATVTTSS